MGCDDRSFRVHTIAGPWLGLLAGLMPLAACAPATPSGPAAITESPNSTALAARTLPTPVTKWPTPTHVPTSTPRPTRTLWPSPTPTITRTPSSYDLTRSAFPTVINPTAGPTPDDVLQKDMAFLDYDLTYSSSHRGPDDLIYSAYLYVRTNPDGFGEADNCRVAFYRLEGTSNVLVTSLMAPYFPEDAHYGGFPPVYCAPNDWSDADSYWYYAPPEPDVIAALHLDGVWSDVNGNGLPEFGVQYNYCANACLNYGALALHLYEIQADGRITDLAADLPGVLEPFNLVHTLDPVTLRVYDPSLWYCYKWCTIDTWWIFAWDGRAYRDVSAGYATDYRKLADEWRQAMTAARSGPFPEWQLLEGLFIYEKAGLYREGYEAFMEASSPWAWPHVSDEERCWLQVTRASISQDFEAGRPFEFPPMSLQEPVDIPFQIPRALAQVDGARFDVSACVRLWPTPTTAP